MELFYAYEVMGGVCRLDAEESGHCVRVLRHRAGDELTVIDGLGTLYRCRLTDDNPKGAEAQVLEETPGWGAHPYRLTIACCPTKNNDRFEWMVEKVTEIGVDRIVPTIGERSERKVYKTERAQRIALSATKQSLKSRIPDIAEPISVKEFIASCGASVAEGCHFKTASANAPAPPIAGDGPLPLMQPRVATGFETAPSYTTAPLKLIAYCFEDEAAPRVSIMEALRNASFHGSSAAPQAEPSFHGSSAAPQAEPSFHGSSVESMPEIIILIGPEGDFSPEEAHAALDAGFVPIHLGSSRLRTETAAVTAATAVYLSCI